jgi:heptosyltransferase-2
MNNNFSKKYLIISPSWLGDLIMAQSLFITLKQQEPDCQIDIYAPQYTFPILDRMPQLTNKIVNPFMHGSFNLKERFAEGKKLRNYHYDCVIVLPNSFKSALIGLFAKIPLRRGFKGESRYFVINDMRSNKHDFPKMVERYVSLAYSTSKVKTAKDLPIFNYPSLETKPLSKELISRLRLDISRKILILGCGANYGPTKLWPTEFFAQVSSWWISKGGSVVALGSKKDAETASRIQKDVDKSYQSYFFNIAGQTSLVEALDIIGQAKCAVCNDSGLMHTVAAADKPQICIFASTSTQYTPPLSNKAICLESTVKCHPCFKKTCRYNTYECLKQIRPEQVIEKLETIVLG